ncbi:MAG: hypothetical protein ABI165_05580, partial [Bryobacteraceae bacterium]
GLDPAAVLQVAVTIEPGRQVELSFLLGEAATAAEVRALVNRYRTPEQVEAALDATRRAWEQRLDTLQVRTPVLSVDLLLNRWLLYQDLSCRFWARSAFYQSGGAFGFRDQLQDSMALFYAVPALARQHILESAARQFVEGDVQHWWHADTGAGVRTRCSDDLVWLPYVAARYIEVTGDAQILDASVAFIEGPALENSETEKLFTPSVAAETAPLWEHCRRALEHAWRLGPHGLPLFGSGDWNDGMNLVGAGGKGESVWLAWFMAKVLRKFASVVELKEPALAALLHDRAASLANAVERSCWDGEWYLRGFFDDGEPLGSRNNPELQIASLPQSWAVISGAADPVRAKRALDSAEGRLVRDKDKLILLFTPPFDHSQPNPGYVMGYPPGVRENGGQYTHGSLWLAMARARQNDGDSAVKLLQLMSPVESSLNPEAVARYRGEPYVMAADVSATTAREGCCGWTWYTGSAGWMYRIWMEEVLGFRLRGSTFTIDPKIPGDWQGFELTYRYRSARYEIVVKRDNDPGPNTLQVDEQSVESVQLADDGAVHRVTLILRQRTPAASDLAESVLQESH